MAKQQQQPKKRKVIYSEKVEIVRKDAVNKYSKWKLMICRWMKVDPVKKHVYFVRIKYRGQHKITQDMNYVLINSEGHRFVVIDSLNKLIMIRSMIALEDRPNLYGTFFIDEKAQRKKSN